MQARFPAGDLIGWDVGSARALALLHIKLIKNAYPKILVGSPGSKWVNFGVQWAVPKILINCAEIFVYRFLLAITKPFLYQTI